MKNLKTKSFWALGLALFALAPLASCSNDEAVALPEPARQLEPGEETTITLYIPETISTRATVDAEAEEAKVKDLWFCAYAKDGGVTVVENIVKNASSGDQLESDTKTKTGDSQYSEYQVKLKQGKYIVYVLANVGDYLTTAMSTTTEENTVKDILLHFGNQKTDNPTSLNTIFKAGALPMGCWYTEIKYTDKNGTATTAQQVAAPNYYFDLTSEGQKLYADLTLLCAKVRYTVLFDNTPTTGFSKDFYDDSKVDFDKSTINKVAYKTYFDNAKTSSTDYIATLTDNSFVPKIYPTDASDTYLKFKSDGNSDYASLTTPPANLTDLGTGSWGANKRAWQGFLYLPENKATDVNKTTITFTPKADNELLKSDYKIEFDQGLIRGNYYDVLCLIKTPSAFYYTVNVYVKVKPWEYVPGVSTDW